MRLSENEKTAIVRSFNEIKNQNNIAGQIFLFGSRTRASRRGGDVDLLWIAPEQDVEKIRSLKFSFIAKVQLYSDMQKIDLTVLAEENKSQDIFYNEISSSLIKLA